MLWYHCHRLHSFLLFQMKPSYRVERVWLLVPEQTGLLVSLAKDLCTQVKTKFQHGFISFSIVGSLMKNLF